MSSLERLAIGALTTTVVTYIALLFKYVYDTNHGIDPTIVAFLFLLVFRSKIGLDDIHYFRDRARLTQQASLAIGVELGCYLLWIIVPLQMTFDLRYGMLLLSFTILCSTVSIALTATDIDNQLIAAGQKSETDAARQYTSLRRFYHEQPIWIINNCLLEGILISAIFFNITNKIILYIVFSAMSVLVALDWFQSSPVSYVIGARQIGDPVYCVDCGAIVGSTSKHDKFCSNCGSLVKKPLSR